MAAARQALIKRIYEDPRNGFGSIADTLRQARQQDPATERESRVPLDQRREIHEHVCMLEAYMRQEPTCFRDAFQACDISEH